MTIESNVAARLVDDLEFLYGAELARTVCRRIEGMVAEYTIERQPGLPAIEELTERDALLITYGNSLYGTGEPPLDTLRRFLLEHIGEAINIIHLLPIFPYSSDDGFAVVDYYAVNPELGKWDNVRELADYYGLALDLVLNHCSRSHRWFQDFIAGKDSAKNWFIEANPNDPRLALVARPRSTPLLTPVDVSGQGRRWIWTTFSPDQVDLNYHNPEVLLAMIAIMLFYVRQGARVLRLDAVAYAWKTLGTSCINLPQVHAIVRILRVVADSAEPGVLLLTETNVPMVENLSYLGQGDEAHLVYQFSLPPLLLYALWRENTAILRNWLDALPEPPPGCTFLNFTASHDGVGLRPLEGLVDETERDAMLDAMRTRGGFVTPRRLPDGREAPYELNITYFSAFDAGDGEEAQLARFLLSQTVMMSLRGVPAIYIHSLFATPNDLRGVEQTGQLRAINRRRWDWGELSGLLVRSDSVAARCLKEMTRRLRVRSGLAQFHPQASQYVLELPGAVLGIVRESKDGERLLCLFNFTGAPQSVPLSMLPCVSDAHADLLADDGVRLVGGGLELAPWGAAWLPAV